MPRPKKTEDISDLLGTTAVPPIQLQRMHEEAVLPTYATPGSACMDLYNCSGFESVSADAARTFRTGWAFELPPGAVMLIFSRSGMGFKNDVRLSNCVGVIDSDYRGEVNVKLTNDSGKPYFVEQHDRIAQALVLRGVTQETFKVVKQLTATGRGAGGFGASGR